MGIGLEEKNGTSKKEGAQVPGCIYNGKRGQKSWNKAEKQAPNIWENMSYTWST